MNEKNSFLYIGLLGSLLFHGFFMQSFYVMSQNPAKKKYYQASYLVPIEIAPKKQKPIEPKVEKPKPPPEKKKVVRVTKKTKINPLPVSHIKKPSKKITKNEEIKPVFGVTRDTVVDKAAAGIGVRIGNTLMKKQEKKYTPPEKVRDYLTVPVFELSNLPSYKTRILPEYPKILKEEGVEGDVMLIVTIDDEGNVVDVKLKHSDHDLFTKAAVAAMKRCFFKPATKNGRPVSVEIDVPIKFILDT